MFDEIKKRLQKSKEQWEEIDEIAEEVKVDYENGSTSTEKVSKLLILLVEHLRPLNEFKNLDNVDKIFKSLMKDRP